MSSTKQDIASFTQFAIQRIESAEGDLTIDELFDPWRLESPSDEEFAENVAAVRASIRDYQAGERGTIAGVHSAVLRRGLGSVLI
jgi:hypothetical protein